MGWNWNTVIKLAALSGLLAFMVIGRVGVLQDQQLDDRQGPEEDSARMALERLRTMRASGDVTEDDLFALYNVCQPMTLVVTLREVDGELEGLTENRIRTVAESRLRAAQLYDSEAVAGELYVEVMLFPMRRQGASSTLGFFHLVLAEYSKIVIDEVTGLRHYVPTWESSGAWGYGLSSSGPRADHVPIIVSGIGEVVDGFVLEYLRVNEADC